MIRTGIFSGSFNPVHIGHLALANWLCEFEELDEVWFVVSPQNPLKAKDDLMDDKFRLQLVEVAIDGYPAFKASDFEFYMPVPSYTIDTLQALDKAYPEHQFHLIMGADNWALIERWKEYEKIITSYPVLVYPRLNYDINILEQYPLVRKVDAPIIEISSTFIREATKAGKDIRFFLPEKVRELYLGI